MKATWMLAILAAILAPLGFMAAMFLMKLGIQSSYQEYGGPFTIGLIALIVPALVVLGFLFDRRQGQTRDNPRNYR